MDEKDTYLTIIKPTEAVLFKDKNSKFYGYAFPINNESQVKIHIENLKKEQHSARHWCYAYQIGTETLRHRANDDGEPNNSAGKPIYGQIQSFELTNILIVVVRYFGGTKLGVSGLINAYKTAAKYAIESAHIIERTINKDFQLHFEYKDLSKVMRILKENEAKIINQKLELNCLLDISVRKNTSTSLFNIFNTCFGVEIKAL